ncbi:MAG: nucleotidyltransferase family protein [Fibrobacterota bacterium]
MRGFILAAGFGTRLKPLTDHIPKALVPVCGEPLLGRNLKALTDAKVFSALAVNTHYLNHLVEDFRKKSEIEFDIFHEEKEIRGTGGALDFARDFLSGDNTFFVANVDILNNFDIADMARRFEESGRICSLVSVPAEDQGTILYDLSSGDYLGVRSEENSFPNASGADFTGAAFYRREFLDFVGGSDFSIIPVWKRAAQKGFVPGIITPDSSCWWRDIGTPAALAQVHFDLLEGSLELNVPEHFELDRNNKICSRAGVKPALLGPYSWYEPHSAPAGYSISRSIVLGEGTVQRDTAGSIITEWGEIRL